MDSPNALRLAVDLLQDAFGDVVAKIAGMLLERGQLTIREILAFGKEESFDDEELPFQQVRNAMLVLTQHGLVNCHPFRQSQDGKCHVQVYALDIDEVLARVRFPQYLEYVRRKYGEQGQELLEVVLKFGRAAQQVLLDEAASASGISAEILEETLKNLVTERILRPVDAGDRTLNERVQAGPTASPFSVSRGKAQGSQASRGAKAPRPEERKRRLEVDDLIAGTPEPIKDEEPAKEEPAKEVKQAVYRFDRVNLDLCLRKAALCRLVEEQLGDNEAMAMFALLHFVVLNHSGEGVTTKYADLEEIYARYLGLAKSEGRDPSRVKEKLRGNLDRLATHKDQLLRKRVSAVKDADMSEWIVDWDRACECLRSMALSQLVRDRFGKIGLRIFNLLLEENPPQKLEEGQIFKIAMIPILDGRELLQAMARSCVLSWQQVARSSDGAVANSVWLYYVDMRRVVPSMLDLAYNSILNLRIRFRAESARVAPMESRALSLGSRGRQSLRMGRRKEDLLERSFLVLDAVPLLCRSVR
ncbi:polr3c [Symbiodinium natans]|uniref:DNA-directed RNA polymerase III subunit RPC3 n=1 Tax=Symbiodinium natans TaxID=878477 RepID=A0A812SLW1_9DINO|nr:polr3c [Symbiodinium natans]